MRLARVNIEDIQRLQRQIDQYIFGDQEIMEAYLRLNNLEAMHQVHDEYYIYEVAKEEEAMATVKTLKNSIVIQGEDDRMDVEFVTRNDGSTCFSITLNDQHVELPVNQTEKLSEFIKSKLN